MPSWMESVPLQKKLQRDLLSLPPCKVTVKKQTLTKHWICLHHGLGLPSLQNCDKSMSFVDKPPILTSSSLEISLLGKAWSRLPWPSLTYTILLAGSTLSKGRSRSMKGGSLSGVMKGHVSDPRTSQQKMGKALFQAGVDIGVQCGPFCHIGLMRESMEVRG